MNFGYKLLLIGLIIAIAGFTHSYEYPTIVTREIEGISAISSLIIIVIGAFFIVKSKSAQNICQNCGQKLDKKRAVLS
jgi:hypothetical protein